MRAWGDSLALLQIEPSRSDFCNAVIRTRNFRLNSDSFSGASKHRTYSQYNIFTDGSRTGGQTGSGFTIYRGHTEIECRSLRLPDYASVFQAQIFAIFRAADTLLSRQSDNPRFVKIFVDSQAALKALINPKITSRLVRDTVLKLNLLGSRTKAVTLVWILSLIHI